MKADFVVTAPGSLLILGEYAILSEGGLGLAVAPDTFVRALVRSSRRLVIRGFRNGVEMARCEAGHDDPFLAALVATVRDAVGRDIPVDVQVDTSAYYDLRGRKLGYGSSAAVAVAVTVALLQAANHTLDEPAGFALAVEAHRRAQGGHGSGYDVACSYFGGVGLFRGGDRPGWTPVRPPWLRALAVFPGPAAVVSSAAVAAYRSWLATHPADSDAFVTANNRIVRRLVEADEFADAYPELVNARERGIELGASIGFPADIAPPGGSPTESDAFAKALGAGNEMGLLLYRDDSLRDAACRASKGETGLRPVEVAGVGVRVTEP